MGNPNKNKTILLVDDEQLILDMYGTKLEMSGYHVLKARNAEDGLILAETRKPDLIFTDIMMEGSDGFWFLKSIREHKDKNLSRIPVIILTNLDDPDSRKRCGALGCLYYLVKPKHIPSDLVRLTDEVLIAKDHNPETDQEKEQTPT